MEAQPHRTYTRKAAQSIEDNQWMLFSNITLQALVAAPPVTIANNRIRSSLVRFGSLISFRCESGSVETSHQTTLLV